MYKRNLRLDKLIVAYLARNPLATTAQIFDEIRRHRGCSIQAIYKMLRSLQSEGSVTRVRDRYLLQLGWALELSHSSAAMVATLLEPDTVAAILPPVGKHISITARSVHESSWIGTHLLLAILAQNRGARYFEYTPFAYYQYANPDAEDRYLRIIRHLDKGYALAVGSAGPLDYDYGKLLRKRVPKAIVCFVNQTAVLNGGCYQALIGDFAVIAHFRPSWLSEFARDWHNRTASNAERVSSICKRLFQLNPVKIEISRRPTTIKRLQRSFAKLFQTEF